MIPANISTHRLHGMSLVELMVALTVGLIVLAAVSTVFVNSKSNYTTQESSARLQESARFGMHFIARDLRLAGYYGCADDVPSINNLLQGGGGIPFDFTTSIEGSEGDTNTLYPSNVALTLPTSGTTVTPRIATCPNFVGGKCSGTDAFAVRMADPGSSASMVVNMPNESAAVFLDPGHGLNVGEIVLLSDCGSAELFQITNIQDGNGPTAGKKGIVHNAGSGTPGNINPAQFKRRFGPPNAQIMKFIHRVYYIGTGQSGHPALFRQGVDGSNRAELVDGISNMQILYGYDTGGDRTPRAYLDANNGVLGSNKANWANVVSARITLTARPATNIGSGPQNDPRDVEVDPKDFSTTVLLRNLQ